MGTSHIWRKNVFRYICQSIKLELKKGFGSRKHGTGKEGSKSAVFGLVSGAVLQIYGWKSLKNNCANLKEIKLTLMIGSSDMT
jgi:hypothetical protein